MRKLISAGLAALLLVAAMPSHADALGGRRGRGKAKATRSSSSANWSQPKASKKSGNAKKRSASSAGLPKVTLPKEVMGGGRGRRRVVAGMNTGAAPVHVDYNADAASGSKRPKLVNGGLGGDDGGGRSARKRGGGKKHGGGKHKKG